MFVRLNLSLAARLLTPLLVVSQLAACGQKGPLNLPKGSAVPTAASAPAR